MVALVWTGIGVFVAALLAVSWWYDRDARRRGATPLSAGQMARAERQRRVEIRRQETALDVQGGATPRLTDTVRDTWAGRPGPDEHRR